MADAAQAKYAELYEALTRAIGRKRHQGTAASDLVNAVARKEEISQEEIIRAIRLMIEHGDVVVGKDLHLFLREDHRRAPVR